MKITLDTVMPLLGHCQIEIRSPLRTKKFTATLFMVGKTETVWILTKGGGTTRLLGIFSFWKECEVITIANRVLTRGQALFYTLYIYHTYNPHRNLYNYDDHLTEKRTEEAGVLRTLPKVTQLISERVGIHIQGQFGSKAQALHHYSTRFSLDALNLQERVW